MFCPPVLRCWWVTTQNMGLYGQRIGTFSLVTADPEQTKTVESQMKVRFLAGVMLQASCYNIIVTS